MAQLCEVVITAPDLGWLKDFSRALNKQRLCASAHSFTPVQSIYRWRGEIYMRCPISLPGPSLMATPITWHGSQARSHQMNVQPKYDGSSLRRFSRAVRCSVLLDITLLVRKSKQQTVTKIGLVLGRSGEI